MVKTKLAAAPVEFGRQLDPANGYEEICLVVVASVKRGGHEKDKDGLVIWGQTLEAEYLYVVERDSRFNELIEEGRTSADRLSGLEPLPMGPGPSGDPYTVDGSGVVVTPADLEAYYQDPADAEGESTHTLTIDALKAAVADETDTSWLASAYLEERRHKGRPTALAVIAERVSEVSEWAPEQVHAWADAIAEEEQS